MPPDDTHTPVTETETPLPVMGDPTPVPDPDPETPVSGNTDRPAGSSDGSRRNYRKYPLFSEAFPSRRLNMEGDPEAWAEVPGICAIENAEILTLLKMTFGV